MIFCGRISNVANSAPAAFEVLRYTAGGHEEGAQRRLDAYLGLTRDGSMPETNPVLQKQKHRTHLQSV